MNCKPGDLAVVVHSFADESVGRILRVIKLSDDDGLLNPDGSFEQGPVWITDDYMIDFGGDVSFLWCDSDLRPIRDNPGNESWFVAAPLSKVKEVV